ncbi:hypothetical protein [Ferruginibacter albus]|uniref:hypothetical protein n=1 Tax=Ferruginibacter albus TaxID=2875540 RepID=UPI001CC5B096|nr:hypothetical protein [Ferruginibacter albus]UAY51470.1 hypothetical protein K9M53_12835 [Ferruginibacter albus]
MILKKDNLVLGIVIGLLAPLLGILLFKYIKFKIFTFKEVFQYIYYEPDHKMLTVALSLSLLLNALFFTIYINTNKDKTAIGIFSSTMFYGLIVLLIKTFN